METRMNDGYYTEAEWSASIAANGHADAQFCKNAREVTALRAINAELVASLRDALDELAPFGEGTEGSTFAVNGKDSHSARKVRHRRGGVMSTRAVVTFKDERDSFSVYQHGDGYPDGDHGMLAKIEAAKPFAWPLPRFEAMDFAAAYIRANKSGPGTVYVTSGPEAHGDLAYEYLVTLNGKGLHIITVKS